MTRSSEHLQGRGGVILIARDGLIGLSYKTPARTTAYIDEETPLVGGIAAD